MKPYYEHAGITIYHGDCRDVLPNPQAGLVVTDPPYGIGVAGWDEFLPVDSWLPLARRIGPVVLFSGVRAMFDYPRPDWIAAWVRVGSTQRNGALRGFNNWEPILMYGVQSLTNDVFSLPNLPDVDAAGHPSPKPRRLMRSLLARLPSGCVVDAFMGSGTTLVEAKRLGRLAIGIEREEKYCEMAAERLSQGALDLEMPA